MMTKSEAFDWAVRTVGFGPITLDMIQTYFKGRNENRYDEKNYTPKEVAYGDKHYQARIDATLDLLDGELNLEDGEFEIERVAYSKNLETRYMWVTFRRKEHAALIHIRQSQMRNREIKVTQRFPDQAWNRIKFLEEMIEKKKAIYPELYYQLRNGYDDLMVMEKPKGGAY